ncbi:MAG: DNA-directed RNA polymerase [Candidatus Jordarchaeum sp.]|uniref:DNA-directed RNA polymerase n=1 Tax=Candidatus Jordarchaeum sp. TaxID=2823881 RepID=UPI00404AAFA1
MYELVTLKDTVRIPPDRFGELINEVALEILMKEYEGIIDPDLGVVISVVGVENVDVGKLLPGDGAAFHKVLFSVLVFKPIQHEIIEGEVVEVVDFGAFIRLGPLDGLCHVSQITDDFISYDSKRRALIGKETGRTIQENDKVRARIVAVSIGGGIRSGKLGLTMRQPFLGKIDWIEEEVKGTKEEKKVERKEPREEKPLARRTKKKKKSKSK